MKKFMKVCGILALVLIVAGFAMALVSGAIGGPIIYSQLKSSLQNLDSGAFFDIENNMAFDTNYTVFQGDTEQSFAAEDVRVLDVEAGACQLVIEESEDEEFHVNVQGAGKYQGYLKGNTLCIKGVRGTALGNGGQECRISLAVPKGTSFQEIELSLGAGQVSGKTELSAERMKIELGAGEITLSGLTAEEFEAEVGMGALTVHADIQKTADVECAMGSIAMFLAGAKTDYNYQVEAAAGEVNIGGQSISGVAGEWNISNDAPRDINVECAMGSIAISFEE